MKYPAHFPVRGPELNRAEAPGGGAASRSGPKGPRVPSPPGPRLQRLPRVHIGICSFAAASPLISFSQTFPASVIFLALVTRAGLGACKNCFEFRIQVFDRRASLGLFKNRTIMNGSPRGWRCGRSEILGAHQGRPLFVPSASQRCLPVSSRSRLRGGEVSRLRENWWEEQRP